MGPGQGGHISANGGVMELQDLQSREACKLGKITVDEFQAIIPVSRGGRVPPPL